MRKKSQAKKTILRHTGNRDRSRGGDKIDSEMVGWGGCHNKVLETKEKQWELGTNEHCSLNL